MLLLKASILGLVVLGCLAGPIPDPDPVPDPQSDKGLGTALEAAGAGQDKYTCECRPVASNDGVRTLQCHCINKANGGSANVDAPAGTAAPPGPPNGGGQGQDIGTPIPGGAGGGGPPPGPGAGTPVPNAPGAGGPGAGTPVPNAPGAGGPGAGTPVPGAGGNQAGQRRGGGAVTPAAGGEDDKFFGDTTAYVNCQKRTNDVDVTKKPDWDWLYGENKKSLEVPGKWVSTQCTGGVSDTFQVSASTYKNTLAACQKLGYEIAMPANRYTSGYYAFQVSDKIQPHFNQQTAWLSAPTYQRVTKEVEVGKCSSVSSGTDNAAGTSQDTFGDEKTYIACLKRGNGWVSSAPDWAWLKTEDGKDVAITGKWVSTTCSYGRIQAFSVREKMYQDALSRCQKLGYEVAQPANTLASGYYAFQTGNDLSEYYSEEKGWVKNGYTRRPRVGSEKC